VLVEVAVVKRFPIMETRVKESGEGWSWLELFPANKCGALLQYNTVGVVLILNF
jgi:hypothetical protein